MNAHDHQRVKTLFLAACEMAQHERAAFLGRECDGDIRAAVEDMLANDDAPIEALAGVGARAHLERILDEDDPLPESIGPYRIIDRLGEGGMGVVYEAEQEQPRRRVALKVINAGPARASARRRFEHEAEALARLSDPAIAQVYEAGTADAVIPGAAPAKVPFIAMELVDGEPIDQYVRRRRPPVRDVLELLAIVCDAVHHAHQKGVIHRDLKPGNILVTTGDDGVGRPKILDFGIARIVDDDRITHQTGAGQLLGTLGSMSPEQVRPDPHDIDIRSDVYALGVLAFQLLADKPPFDIEGLSVPEATRLITEHEPPHLGTIHPSLRGDIETIVSKALEKDPQRRYQSAAMADDLRRHVHDEPILARPASTVYQLGKFARRHRALVGAVGAIAAVLLIASMVGFYLAARESAARDLAESRTIVAEDEAEKYKVVLAFLEDTLRAADPTSGSSRPDLTIREAIDLAAARVADLDAKDEVGVAVRMTIGNTYRSLGDLDKAKVLLEEAVKTGRRIYPEGHADLAYALNKLARVHQSLVDYDRADELFNEALSMRQTLYGDESEEVAVILNNLGWLRMLQGDGLEAKRLLAESLRIRRARGDTRQEVATVLNNLGLVEYNLGNLPRAVELLEESLALDLARRGEDHPNVSATTNNLGFMLVQLGRYDDGEEMTRRALDMGHRMLGQSHPQLVFCLSNHGSALRGLGRYDEAERDLLAAIELGESLHPDDHPTLASSRHAYAQLLIDLERYEEAETMLRHALDARMNRAGPTHPHTLSSRYALAGLLLDLDRLDEAQIEAEAVVDGLDGTLPDGHWRHGTAAMRLGEVLAARGLMQDARANLEQGHAILEASLGPDHARTKACTQALATLDR